MKIGSTLLPFAPYAVLLVVLASAFVFVCMRAFNAFEDHIYLSMC